MKAVVLTGHGGPEVLRAQDWPDPPVGPGQVRIAVRAAGVNFADTLARVGFYREAPKPPCVLGYEVAGEVESAGPGVEGLTTGDRVMAATRFRGQAELVTVPAAHALPLPERLSFEQGAAFPVNYGTAFAALVVMGGIGEGDRVLIHSAAGGVGIAATQIARARGAEIYGTASGWKHDAIKAQGVDHAIDYHGQDFEAEINQLTNGTGVDVIIDALGPSSFRKDYRLLRAGGRLVVYGASVVQKGTSRNVPAAMRSLVTMPFATMPWWRSLRMIGENKSVGALNLLTWWDREGSFDRLTKPLLAGLESGELDPVVAESFPFDRAADAHRFIAERSNVGKVVLVP